MTANITITLLRANRHGKTVLTERKKLSRCSLEQMINNVNEYIYEYVHKSGTIPVKTFHVSIVDYKRKEIYKFDYSPTYRS